MSPFVKQVVVMRGKVSFSSWIAARKAVLHISLDPCECVTMTVSRFQFSRLCCSLGEESPTVEKATRISAFGLQMSPIMMLGTCTGGSRAKDNSEFCCFPDCYWQVTKEGVTSRKRTLREGSFLSLAINLQISH